MDFAGTQHHHARLHVYHFLTQERDGESEQGEILDKGWGGVGAPALEPWVLLQVKTEQALRTLGV